VRLVKAMDISSADAAGPSFVSARTEQGDARNSGTVNRIGGSVEIRLPRNDDLLRPETLVKVDSHAIEPGSADRLIVVSVFGSDVEQLRDLVPEEFREPNDKRVEYTLETSLGEIRWSPTRFGLERPVLVATFADADKASNSMATNVVGAALRRLDADAETVQSAVAETTIAIDHADAPAVNLVKTSREARDAKSIELMLALATLPERVEGASVEFLGKQAGLIRRSREVLDFRVSTGMVDFSLRLPVHERLDTDRVLDDVAEIAGMYREHPWVMPIQFEVSTAKSLGREGLTVGRYEEDRQRVQVRVDCFDAAQTALLESVRNLRTVNLAPPTRDAAGTTSHELGHAIAASYGALFDFPDMASGSRAEAMDLILRSDTSWVGSGRIMLSVLDAFGMPEDVSTRSVRTATVYAAAQEDGMLHLYLPEDWTRYLTHVMGSYAMSNVQEFVAESFRYAARPVRPIDFVIRDAIASTLQPLDELVASRPDILPMLRKLAASRLLSL